MTIILAFSQLLSLGSRQAALAEDLGSLTITKTWSFSDYDDINWTYEGIHAFEVDVSNGIAFCGTKNLAAPELGATFTGGYVSNNPALDWVIYHGWSPDHRSDYGLSESRFRFVTQYLVWLAMPDCKINDHWWARTELKRTYEDVRQAAEQMESEMQAYVDAGGGGPERGCSVVWPSANDEVQYLVTRRNPTVQATLHKDSSDASLTFGNDAYSLAGAVYEIHRCVDDVLVATVTTDATGKATCELATGTRYYAKETSAPKGYLLSEKPIEFEVAYEDVEVDVSDLPGRAEIRVQKVDSATGAEAQPGCSLAGAELTLVDARGRGHVGVTSEEGWVIFDNLPLGPVRITETRAPEGYRISDEVIETEVAGAQLDADGIAHIEMASALPEDAVAFDLEIAKFKDYGQEGSGIEQPAAGVVFQIISNTTGEIVGEVTTNEYGFADTSSDPTLWFGAGTRGDKINGALPYDAAGYTVHEVESTVPAGFSHVGDWSISAEAMADGAKLQYIVDNHALATHLQVVKQDAKTGQAVPLAGFTFQILDVDGNPITQENWYPNHVSLDRFTSNESGCVTLPQALIPGTYYIHEIAAQAPYLVGTEDVRIEVPAEATLTPVVIARYADEQAAGSASIAKMSEGGVALAGAEFDVVAQELVRSPDGTVQAVEGQVMGHVTTDKDGKATIGGLPLGAGSACYAFVETKAPEGFVLNPEPWEFVLSWENDATAVVTADVEATNALATGRATIHKVDAATGDVLAGAEFDVIAAKDMISYDGQTTLAAGDIVGHTTTDENGTASVDGLMLCPDEARYAFVETTAPEGYLLDATPHEFTLAYAGQEVAVVTADITAQNDFTKLEVSKLDEKGEFLAGARLVLLDANENVIETWESSDGPHRIEHLEPGEYTLAEKEAPAGYQKAEPIRFKVEETSEVQAVDMTDLLLPKEERELPKTGDGLPLPGILAGISIGCSILGYLLVKRRD